MSLIIDLSGKAAIVTGASRGLGKAIALALAQAGAKVALAARSKENIEQLAQQINDDGGQAIAVQTDITDEDDVKLLVDLTKDTFGGIHILVNNAGIERSEPLLKVSSEKWDEVMNVNLKGMFLVTKAVGPVMIEQKWGRVLNMASVGGTIAGPNNASYHTSKAGAILFSKSMAIEWARHNITVNALAPGFFQTDMLDSLVPDPKFKDKLKHAVPLRRFGDPKELGPLAVYLCSDAASYLTGQAIIIDGGLSSM